MQRQHEDEYGDESEYEGGTKIRDKDEAEFYRLFGCKPKDENMHIARIPKSKPKTWE